MTGITIIALGTSLPDTFASRTAARQDEYADAAIGNVTGKEICRKISKGYSIKTYHPGGDPTLKLAKPPLEVQLSVYRPTLEPCSFNTYPPLEEIFYIFQDGFSCVYVCMYVCNCMYTPV